MVKVIHIAIDALRDVSAFLLWTLLGVGAMGYFGGHIKITEVVMGNVYLFTIN